MAEVRHDLLALGHRQHGTSRDGRELLVGRAAVTCLRCSRPMLEIVVQDGKLFRCAHCDVAGVELEDLLGNIASHLTRGLVVADEHGAIVGSATEPKARETTPAKTMGRRVLFDDGAE